MMGRGVRRLMELLDDFQGTRGYCKLKGEAPDRYVWRIHIGRSYEPVTRQTAE
jgi:hypothetical protein